MTGRGDLSATVRLALPLVGAQLAQSALTVTDTAMLGQVDATALAAGSLGSQAMFQAVILGSGFAHAVTPLAAAAIGSDQPAEARRAARMGVWAVLGASALLVPVLWSAAPLLRAAGQPEAVIGPAATYLRITSLAVPLMLFIFVLRSFLSTVGHAGIVLWATLVGVAVNAGLNWVLIFGKLGAPALGVTGAAVATTATMAAMSAILAVYAARHPDLRRYDLFRAPWRPDWRALAEVVRLGWPISLTLFAETGLFFASAVMMGWLGVVPLAAHGIALQIATLAFQVPLGLSQVAAVRVGQARGAASAVRVRGAVRAAVAVALAGGVAMAAVMVALPETLTWLFLDAGDLDAAAVVATGAGLVVIAAAFQFVDALQAVVAGCLRGLADTRVPMAIAAVSYWGVGLPVAWVLAFPLGMAGVGVWLGLAAGLAVAAGLLSLRLARAL